ncbi:ankyrin repeat-containing domain protein [Russula earlei]|uniref:Ankyrin repeat-containing domain protein n=1 Tax=Russula earlei TaxID=71964 RepID=A0ACC0TXT9_9AGAM|nr:ankyrin repeat-containing domain protein [Russula earlei]
MDTLSEKPSLPDVTPLYFAALCGFSELAEHLIITHGEDVNAYSRNSRWATPLGAALYRGHVDAALVLLDHGADTNGTTLGSRSPLSAAYHGNHVKGMQLLLEHGANVEDRRYFALGTALHDASFRGNVKIVDLLLRHKADANARGVNKQVPLGIASIEGHLEIARLLLKNGADVNAVDPGYTALSAAAFEGHLDLVRLLVDNGADVRPQSGGNALQLATTKGHHEIAQLLLEHCSKRDEPL